MESTDHSWTENAPMDAIKDWQIWYKQHNVVAEMNEPLATKDSREKLHDTTNATNSQLEDWRSGLGNKDVYFKSAVEHFGDTLAEFANELTAAQMYEAFLYAAMDAAKQIKQDYENAQELVDLIKGEKNNDK